MGPDDAASFGIRAATLADAQLLSEMGRRTFAAAFGAANHPADLASYLDRTYTTPHLQAELTDSDSDYLVALADASAVGFAKLRRGTSGAGVGGTNPLELQRLYTDLPWIGRGVGGFLLDNIIHRAGDRGHDGLWLAVWERNPRARLLYERHGFRAVGEQEFVLGSDSQRDIVMELRSG